MMKERNKVFGSEVLQFIEIKQLASSVQEHLYYISMFVNNRRLKVANIFNM
jgi:hypothetical protein